MSPKAKIQVQCDPDQIYASTQAAGSQLFSNSSDFDLGPGDTQLEEEESQDALGDEELLTTDEMSKYVTGEGVDGASIAVANGVKKFNANLGWQLTKHRFSDTTIP